MHPRSKGKVSQDRQFLGSVGAVDIHGRISFCEPEVLRFLYCRVIVRTALLHLGHNEVAGAVEDTAKGRDFIGRQALTDIGDDRNTAGNRRLESNRSAQFASCVK